MATAKKSAKNAPIAIVPVEVIDEQSSAPKAGSNQLSLAVKAPKPTKLRISTVQGKALAKEIVAQVERQAQSRKDQMHYDASFLEAREKYMKTDELCTSLAELEKIAKKLDLDRVNELIRENNNKRVKVYYTNKYGHRDSYWEGINLSTVDTLDVSGRLKELRDNFYFIYWKKELAELADLNVSEEIIYNRIMVKTITFTNAGTLEQFQRETVTELYPAVARLVPGMNSENYDDYGRPKAA